MEHKLPPLPYAMDALQPHISKETNGRKVHVPEQFVPHFKAGRELRERIDS